jgi:hypothetical protein
VPHNRRVISAADGQALQTAQQVMDAVRSAYEQEPSPMLIADASLNPLELIVVDGQSGRYYRVPVTGNDDGTFSFGAPIPVTGPTSPGTVNPGQPGGTPSQAASRGVSARDRQRIQAALDRGALPPHRAAFWEAKAAAGEDISVVDQAVAVLPLTAMGKVAAAVSPENAEYDRLFGARAPQEADGGSEYGMLFGSVEEGQRRADEVRAAVRKEVATLTDDELHERMFPGASRRAAAAPVVASAAGPVGQHGRGEARPRQYRVHAPQVSLRVPRSPNGLAAGAAAETSWRTIELRGGDRVPEDAHPDDIARLLHQKNRLGPLIKPV